MSSDERVGDWIQTYSGVAFWPLDPRPEEIDILDIAHALSHQCRFSGHTKWFYSVAEHSFLVSTLVSPKDKLWALLHDASEAYLVDVPRPIKNLLPEYKVWEERLMRVIARRFGLQEEMPDVVKMFDSRMLATEKIHIMGQEPRRRGGMEEPIADLHPYLWQPETAKRRFLAQFVDITRGRYES